MNFSDEAIVFAGNQGQSVPALGYGEYVSKGSGCAIAVSRGAGPEFEQRYRA